ncbi:MAG: hypothetical protein U9Q72_02705 [Patescibacteria group bacterium]|nr:hypothetical protein [Patescibacteria group bacterium]
MKLNKLQEKLRSKSNEIEKRPHDFNLLNPQNTQEGGAKNNTPEKEKWQKGNEVTLGQKKSLLKIIIGIFVLLGFLLGGYGFYLYKTRQFSPNNVILSFDTPESMETGREFSFSFLYHNNNRVDLQDCQLKIFFPESLEIIQADKQADDVGKDFMVFNLGELSAQKNGAITFQGKITEKAQAITYLNATLIYKNKSGGKTNERKVRQGIKVMSSKILAKLEATRQITSGDLAEYLLTIKNNTYENLENIEAQFNYPGGFTYSEANIAPVGDESNTFRLSMLAPGEEATISINGSLIGSTVEKKIISVQIGIRNNENFTILAEESAQTEMISSPLTIQQEISSGLDEKGNADSGNSLLVKIKYKNSSDLPMKDVTIVASLEGKAIDFNSVTSENGDFNLGQRKIVWRGGNIPQLQTLKPQEEGTVSFTFNILSFLPADSLDDKNFEISFNAQIDSPDVPTPIATNKLIASDEKRIKVNSKVFFQNSGFYNDNIINNFGPIPPKVGKETSYTIHWKIVNVNNDISEVTVRASLPDYVDWKNNFHPTGVKELTFDERTHEVVWNPGKIPAQTGTQLGAKETVFQVSITPQENQIGQSLTLINKATLTGTDTFTEKIYQLSDEAIDTELKDDISVDYSGGEIVE